MSWRRPAFRFLYLIAFLSLQQMVRAEGGNARRFQSIDRLRNLLGTIPTLSEELVGPWIAEQYRFTMEHIEEPKSEEVQVLIDLALRNGGYRVLGDVWVTSARFSFSRADESRCKFHATVQCDRKVALPHVYGGRSS